MPCSTIHVAAIVEIELVPLTINRVERFGRTRNNRSPHFTPDFRFLGILSERRKIAPSWLHHRLSGEEQVPTLPQRPTDRLFWPAGKKLCVVLQGAKMTLRIDQRFHRVWVKPEIFVVRRTDVRSGQGQEMEKALFVDLGMEGDSPVILAIPVPIPSSIEIGDVIHLFVGLGRIREVVADLVLELLLILRLIENVPAIIKDLTIPIEENSVNFTLPAIKRLH